MLQSIQEKESDDDDDDDNDDDDDTGWDDSTNDRGRWCKERVLLTA